MKRRPKILVVLAALFLSGLLACGPKAKVQIPERPGRVDAPYELQSDEDLEESRTLFDALSKQASTRADTRRALAAEYARRIDALMKVGKATRALNQFKDLLTLWTPEEQRSRPADMRAFWRQARRLRDRFSRSGGTNEAVLSLAALTIMDPKTRSPMRMKFRRSCATAMKLPRPCTAPMPAAPIRFEYSRVPPKPYRYR
jgi:hypothetical protein